jgi:dTDP-4-dehydrorhamnose 3,5-epimerase
MDKLTSTTIAGVYLTPLKIIERDLGNIMHALKADERDFDGFGEVYFTFVNKGAIKGWKKHRRMRLNLIVPLGEVKFVLFDDRENSVTKNCFFDVNLSRNNYQRLSVEPGIWIAFKGISAPENMVVNVASIRHDPLETIDQSVDASPIKYTKW